VSTFRKIDYHLKLGLNGLKLFNSAITKLNNSLHLTFTDVSKTQSKGLNNNAITNVSLIMYPLSSHCTTNFSVAIKVNGVQESRVPDSSLDS